MACGMHVPNLFHHVGHGLIITMIPGVLKLTSSSSTNGRRAISVISHAAVASQASPPTISLSPLGQDMLTPSQKASVLTASTASIIINSIRSVGSVARRPRLDIISRRPRNWRTKLNARMHATRATRRSAPWESFVLLLPYYFLTQSPNNASTTKCKP